MVDSVDVDTVMQGTPYVFEVDCAPAGSVGVIVARDLNGNLILDPGERSILGDESVFVVDNEEEPEHDNPFFDSDTVEGRIRLEMAMFIAPGDWIIAFYEGSDTLQHPLHFLPPDPLLRSVSGTITFEEMTLPDTILSGLAIIAYNTDLSLAMFSITDSMGFYSFNWPGDPEWVTVKLNPIGEIGGYLEDSLGYIDIGNPGVDTIIFIGGHLTGVDFFVPFWVPDTGLLYGYIQSSDGEPITSDSLLEIFVLHSTWDEEADSEIITGIDTIFADCDSGHFETKIALDRWGNAGGDIGYYNVPPEYMKPCDNGQFWFNPEWGDTVYEFNDTLFTKNDSLWIVYSFDGATTPLAVDLPLRISNWEYGSVESNLPSDSTVTVHVYSDSAASEWGISYNVSLASDTILPENYGFYGGDSPWVNVGDTLELLIGEHNVFVAGTVFSASGEIICDAFSLSAIEHSTRGGFYDTQVFDGTFEIGLFDNIDYEFQLEWLSEGYMTPPSTMQKFDPGYYAVNFTLYPLDTVYYLYLDIDSYDPMDDTLSIRMLSPDSQHSYISNFATNRWEPMPIYSGFTDSCRIRILNKYGVGYEPPFTRIVENNGNIPAMPGDSIYLSAELPIDNFTMEFERDSADSWQYIVTPEYFTIQYYDIADTHLVYSYFPMHECGMSLELPIFEQQLLVKVETPWMFDLHHFLANPDDYLRVGGPYRPDRVEKYMNSGSGEVLLTLEGYPAEYLGDDTIWLPHGDFSGVETPDFPGHHYIADLFFFRTDMWHHPYGDGSVMAFHDVCDGEWTVILPDTFPGGFVPTVTETTFYCHDMSIYPDDWQEFPIQISVGSPDGVHGYINREMRYFQASWIQADYYLQATDSLVASKTAWQYYPWGPPSILAKYFIRETELPADNYYIELTYSGWTAVEPFIYPERIEFTYPGDSLLLPDSYIGMTKGYANVAITGLDASFHDGATIHLLPLPDSIPEAIAFYNIDAEYSFPEPGSLLTLKIPYGSWIIRPVVPFGLVATPAETVLHVPIMSDSMPIYDIEFDYDDVSVDGAVTGNLVVDPLDPSPVVLDSTVVRLIGYGDTLAIYETEPDDSGYFAFDSIFTPSNLTIDIRYDGGGEVFHSLLGKSFFVDLAETLDVGEIYVDNANATAIVGFHGLSGAQLNTISTTTFVPLDGYMLGDTFDFAFNSGASRDTFFLCDGEWRVIPQKVLGVDFVPIDTIFSIDESYSTYRVTFVNPAGIGETKLPREFDLAAYPNPFNGAVLFTVSLPEPTGVSLAVFDLTGRRVATIAHNNYEAGVHRLRWNGKTDNGNDLSSGVYLYRIETAKYKKTIKGVYLK